MEAFGVVLLMVVAGSAIAVAHSLNQRKRANTAWREAASRRSLLFRPGDLFTQPQLAGTLEGHRLSITVVSRGADTAQKYTRYRVEHRQALPAGLRISKQPTGFLAGVRRAFASEDSRLGDPEFDDRLHVHGGDAVLLQAFLTLPRRQMLLRVSDLYPGIQIDHRQLSCDVKDVEVNPELIVNTIDRLIETATSLSPDPSESGRDGGARTEATLDAPTVQEASRVHHILLPAADAGRPELDLPLPLADLEDREHPPQPETPVPASRREDLGRDDTPSRAVAVDSAAQEVAADPEDAPAVAAVCATAFDISVARADTPQAFADRYRGRRVRWSGKLASVARYPFDRVFGSEPGCRAVFAVHRMERSFGSHDVRAILQLPDGEEVGLRTCVGRTFQFEGILIDFDRFMQTLFVADGRILSRSTSVEPG